MNDSKNLKLELSLTPLEQAIARDFQVTYEKIFNERISLEEVFKIAMFHTLHLNNIKLTILESYKDNKVIKANSLSNKISTNTVSKKPRDTTRKKRKIHYKDENTSQSTLGGIP